MAERRMFTKKITDADAFTALPPTTQALYFHLCMGADDDGFSNKIRQAMFNAHADQNDFTLLVQKRYIIPFDNGVIAIKHWRLHNTIRNDRYHETEYADEKAKIVLKENGVYTERKPNGNQVTTNRIPTDNQMETEVSIGKDSIDKNNNISSQDDAVYKEIISYLNEKTGKHYRPNSKAIVKLINGRLAEDFTVEDFKKVIDIKCSEWIGNKDFEKFLRPETLFSLTHFESYLNQKAAEKQKTRYNFDELEKFVKEN